MPQLKKILITAGEASSDMHAANLLTALNERLPNLTSIGFGGQRLAAAGQKQIVNIDDLAFIGYVDIVKNLGKIRHIYNHTIELMDKEKPDLFIPVDYPGLNLRLAKAAHDRGIPVYYYISPQVWAWGKNRLKKMKAFIDLMIVVFQFEVDIYQNSSIPVFFTGHPLLDVVKSQQSRLEFFKLHNLDPNKPLIGILPGSRKQEIARLLPNMIQAINGLGSFQSIIGIAPSISEQFINSYSDKTLPKIRDTYDLIAHADILWVCSGTATLESGMMGTPMIVMYKMPSLNWYIARKLVKIPYIGLVNIALGEQVVPELLQIDVNPQNIIELTDKVFSDRFAIKDKLNNLHEKLGTIGVSSRIADKIITDFN